MTFTQILEKLQSKQGQDTSWEFTKYNNEKGQLSHIVYLYRWVENNQITDIEIRGSNMDSNDWIIVREKHTNSYMELYKTPSEFEDYSKT